MTRLCHPLWILLILSLISTSPGAESLLSFNRDIRPILSANCFACHGPDEEAVEGDLRLDSFEAATEFDAIVPGKPEKSELIARIESSDPEDLMPPPDSGHTLTDQQKKLLRQWIKEGGKYTKHWSFTQPIKTAPPETSNPDWIQHEIDSFILARLDDAGISPSPKADPFQLLRRVSLDLTGLPPTVEDADKFAADPSPEAYRAYVDQLLSSPAFGEHWARMWLDLARYADTRGYEKDRPRTIWRYRDWVIDALNADMPYDEFTLHQLAGDLLPNATSDQILATAFHRNTMTNEEGGTDDEEFRVAAVKDRVDTTMQVWMGLTMACAKCHTHKYDPITIEDYYSTYAIFNQTADADRGDDSPVIQTPTKEQNEGLKALEKEIETLKTSLTKKPEGFDQAYTSWKEQQPVKWHPVSLDAFESKNGVTLEANANQVLVARGTKPAEDQWTLTVLPSASDKPLTSLRLDILPANQVGSKWDDGNFTIHFDAKLLVEGQPPKPIKFKNGRAQHEQRGWPARNAIDGNTKTGWAVGGNEKKHNVALFDFEKPLALPKGVKLCFQITFPYKNHNVVTNLRFSTSSSDPKELEPELNDSGATESRFARQVFPATKTLHAKKDSLEKELATLRKQIPSTPVLRELPDNKRRKTHIHLRGNFLEQGKEEMKPRIPSAFGTLPEDAKANRAAFAKWLCSDDNPLTARVMVNRIWGRLFGTGLVETEEDFGLQGTYPSHPELLDWLAVDYREKGWKLKSLLRSLVLSSTYQQSSKVTSLALEKDPANRLLGRGARFRLSAETIRDQALFSSGLLTNKIGGSSVFPPQPDGVWKTTYSALKWQNATDENRYRRGLYTFLKRTSPHPAMTAFDVGSGEVCLIRRIRTNTPLQSLVTLNDPAFLEAAVALANKMKTSGDKLTDQINHGFRLVLIRKPNDRELDRLESLYHDTGNDLAKAGFPKSANLPDGDPGLIAVAHVLLNLDETLTKP
ncbi:MAG: DUF1553 domain-containing protein [Akkermansiaceae bacterium]